VNKLDKLPDIVEETLGGLQADRALYQRVISGERRPARQAGMPLRRVLALACSLVFVLGIGAVGLNLFLNREQQMPRIHTQAAGSLPEGGVLSAWDLPRGSITLDASGSVPKYKGVWANGSSGNFPLVRVDGGYYRLLSNPSHVEGGLLAGQLGTVEVYTEEPALDQGQQVLSNIVPQGTAVYAVSGMQGAAVAAEVEGRTRVFQRVSFSGSALLGGEGLGSTLQGQVVGLQLSGVGTVTDPGQVSSLMSTLTGQAAWQGPASRGSDQALLIQYANGIVLQMAVRGSNLIACGTWSNQAFLEAFQAAVGQ